MSRLIKDSIMLNEDLAIGSDKCGNVFGLLYNEGLFSSSYYLNQPIYKNQSQLFTFIVYRNY